VGAKHEPSSSSSFVVSLATAALRGILVVAAVVVGFVILSSAFPTGDSASVPTLPSPTETEEPQTPETTTPTRTPTEAAECPDAADVPPIQVLNGTTVTGLAADAAETLVQMGYNVPQAAISNATRSDYQTSIVLAKRPEAQAADCLVQEEFRGADRETQAPDAEYDITVILGEDYANRQG
jgi:hypothetical protein